MSPADPSGAAPSPVAPRGRARRLLRVGAAALLLALVAWLAGPRAIWTELRGADARWLAAGLASAIAANIASALRWRALVGWLGHPVGVGWALAAYFRAVAINALLPGAVLGGDMYRAWQLRRDGCPLPAAGASVVLDRVSGLWILFALAAIGLALGAGTPQAARLASLLGVPAHWPVVPIAMGALALVLGAPLALLAAWRAGGAIGQRLALLHRPGALRMYAHQAASSLAVQVLSVGALACAARALGIALPWWLIAVTAAPIFTLAALPIGFGGWGTREAATAASWAAFGVAAPAAVGASMAYGLYALAQAAIGVPLLLAPGRSGEAGGDMRLP